MNKKGIIIQGSARGDGNTNKISKYIKEQTGFEIIDLSTKNIGAFDYKFKNKDDDFMPLINEILDNYDILIFISPVYWYSMSGILKTFFDRISDCLTIEKETGRKFRGKNMIAISCGSDNKDIDGFFTPFVKSSDYLGMNYLGDIHSWIESGQISELLKTKLTDFLNDKMNEAG